MQHPVHPHQNHMDDGHEADAGAAAYLHARRGQGCSSSLGHAKHLGAAAIPHIVLASHLRSPYSYDAGAADHGGAAFDQGTHGVLALVNSSDGAGGSWTQATVTPADVSPAPKVFTLGMVNAKPKPSVRTSSPSGRTHPDKQRREDLRLADSFSDVSFFASSRNRVAKSDVKGPFAMGKAAGPQDDENSTRLPHTQGWIGNQAWLESLRYYGGLESAAEEALTGSFNGKTHARRLHGTHFEAGVRHRVGAAAADPGWSPDQLPKTWAPDAVSPSMQKRLDKTLRRLMNARAQSAPHPRRPGTGSGGTNSAKPDRLAQLAAPRGDPLQRQARTHAVKSERDGAGPRDPVQARKQYDQHRRALVGPIPERRAPTRFVHGVVNTEGKEGKGGEGARAGGGRGKATAGGGEAGAGGSVGTTTPASRAVASRPATTVIASVPAL